VAFLAEAAACRPPPGWSSWFPPRPSVRFCAHRTLRHSGRKDADVSAARSSPPSGICVMPTAPGPRHDHCCHPRRLSAGSDLDRLHLCDPHQGPPL